MQTAWPHATDELLDAMTEALDGAREVFLRKYPTYVADNLGRTVWSHIINVKPAFRTPQRLAAMLVDAALPGGPDRAGVRTAEQRAEVEPFVFLPGGTKIRFNPRGRASSLNQNDAARGAHTNLARAMMKPGTDESIVAAAATCFSRALRASKSDVCDLVLSQIDANGVFYGYQPLTSTTGFYHQIDPEAKPYTCLHPHLDHNHHDMPGIFRTIEGIDLSPFKEHLLPEGTRGAVFLIRAGAKVDLYKNLTIVACCLNMFKDQTSSETALIRLAKAKLFHEKDGVAGKQGYEAPPPGYLAKLLAYKRKGCEKWNVKHPDRPRTLTMELEDAEHMWEEVKGWCKGTGESLVKQASFNRLLDEHERYGGVGDGKLFKDAGYHVVKREGHPVVYGVDLVSKAFNKFMMQSSFATAPEVILAFDFSGLDLGDIESYVYEPIPADDEDDADEWDDGLEN
ncbi:hypothetical protein DFJ74DRAFT_36269 [Hyaloraphidium curvatum]|nr:hypothetical protein DFJ74DRAFT_36269 [Hyaloraphidium curvatum]